MSRIVPARRVSPCPHCGNKTGICDEWRAHLHRIRDDMKAETDRWVKRMQGRKGLGSTCCTVGCYEPRVPPNAFCEECLQSGASEDD